LPHLTPARFWIAVASAARRSFRTRHIFRHSKIALALESAVAAVALPAQSMFHHDGHSTPPFPSCRRRKSLDGAVLLTCLHPLYILPRMKVAPYFPGFLLVIDGIDGAGKSTQAKVLGERLAARGHRVVLTKEPTTGRWGQLLRDSAQSGRLSIEEEVETFLKDRREHVTELILPRLREGCVVIVDRYYFSTMAYQGARGVDPQELMRRNEEFAPEPDLLALFDLEVERGLGRVRKRGDQANLFEQTESLRRARAIFLSIKKPYLLKIDARRKAEEISAEILAAFDARYAAAQRASASAP
jgi:dTMP kinase